MRKVAGAKLINATLKLVGLTPALDTMKLISITVRSIHTDA
jgi:hypothetical protein